MTEPATGDGVLRANRLGRRPATLVGHAGVTGTWLFHCPELDLHLAGSIDQATTRARSAPFRLMARILRARHRRSSDAGKGISWSR